MRLTLTAGVFMRRRVRRVLMETPSVIFEEERGLLDSLFIIKCSLEDGNELMAKLERL